jgi:hypothetical protein
MTPERIAEIKRSIPTGMYCEDDIFELIAEVERLQAAVATRLTPLVTTSRRRRPARRLWCGCRLRCAA